MWSHKNAVALAIAGTLAVAAAQAAPIPTDEPSIVHVLNRTGFGLRSGDLEAVRRMGITKYIDQQLHPERIVDEALESHQRFEGRDLAVTTDFRDVFGEIVVRHLGVSDPDRIFPGYHVDSSRFPGLFGSETNA